MNPRTFLKDFEESVNHDRLVDLVYDEFARYCRDEGITKDEIDNKTLVELAEAFVVRGFGVPESDETATSRRKWEGGED